MRTLPLRAIAIGVACSIGLVGCAGSSDGRSEIVVSAASSLTDAFTELAASFEQSHPDIDVILNFGGSSTLREQILEGAGVDVFASADPDNVEAVSADVVGTAEAFARNVLQIGVPRGNPANVVELEDFERPDLLLGMCVNGVPCGDLAERVLAAAGVEVVVDTYEPNVRALLGKLEVGALDAGLVYATDVLSSDTVEGIAITGTDSSVYVVARLDESPAASAFVDFVLSDPGQRILGRHGFLRP